MKLPTLGDEIPYQGHDMQVVQVQDVSEANTFGEPEYLFFLMNGLGEILIVSETELVNDRKANNV